MANNAAGEMPTSPAATSDLASRSSQHRTRTSGMFTSLPLLVFLGVVLVSGVAGLGYQMVWTRLMSVALGHEVVAVLAVISAFFCGLALGGWLLNQAIANTRKPWAWYIGLETVIALWSILLIFIMPHYNLWLANSIGTAPSPVRHWGFAFGATFIVLCPATLAMGATLPALEAVLRARWAMPGRIALLYGLNTLGAVIGTLAVTFFVIPMLGLNNTLGCLVTLNVLCVIISYILSVITQSTRIASLQHNTALPVPKRSLVSGLALCGLLGIGYEVVVVRVLSQALENTVYSYAAMLGVYLVGTSIGAFLFQRFWKSLQNSVDTWRNLRFLLALACAVCCLIGAMVLYQIDTLYFFVQRYLGSSQSSAMLAELICAATVFLLPTIAMGALLCHFMQPSVEAIGLGKALAVNTLMGASAPLLFGIGLLPLLGAKTNLLLISVGYLVLGFTHVRNRYLVWLSVPALFAAVVALMPPLRILNIGPGSDVIAYQDGVMASVAVVEDETGGRHLKVNNHFTMGGTASRLSDHRQTHLPFLLHRNLLAKPRGEALFLGLGTGITLQAAKYYNNVHATGVELIPEMLPLLPYFDVQPQGADWLNPPSLISADARRFVLASDTAFDIVVAEIFHPSRDGAGALYTVEHFQAVRQRLADDGVFAQWLPLFQLDMPTLKSIIASFIEVFPHAELHLGHFSLRQPILCLIGRNRAPAYTQNWLVSRVFNRELQTQLIDGRLNSDLALFGGYLADKAALQNFVAGSPLNSDDHPFVNYHAPSFVYRNPASPATRLAQLNKAFAPQAEQFLSANSDQEFTARLQAYWRARTEFLHTGIVNSSTSSTTQMLANSRVGLLQSLRYSPEFDPAYRALLATVQALYPTAPELALATLDELLTISDQFTQARRLREQLSRN